MRRGEAGVPENLSIAVEHHELEGDAFYAKSLSLHLLT